MSTDKTHPSRPAAGMIRRARKSERGSAIIEAAFVTPLFFLLIFGIFEFGFLFRNYLTMANASREGARAASVSGDSPEADFLVLRTVQHAFAAWGVENLDYIVIYHATGPGDTVPEACKISSMTGTPAAGNSPAIPGICNRYRPEDFQLGLYDADGNSTGFFLCEETSLDRHWCPIDRITGLSEESDDASFEDGPAYIGLYMQATHHFMTGFIGSTALLSDDQVIRIEPDRQ